MLNRDDYKADHRGNLVPKDRIKPVDLLRDDLVAKLVAAAVSVSEIIADFKDNAMGEITAFCEQSAQEYNTTYGGTKGNIQLLSFDGKYKVVRSINEYIVFDERLQVAKKLVDQCISEWTNGATTQLKALVNHAFEVDKQGNINTERILSLRRLDIQDTKWQQAMAAISDSIQITGSKQYIRVYIREDDGKYKQIPLDLSAV